MRSISSHRYLRAVIILLFILLCFATYSQVGIGNTNPNSDALLDIGNGTDTSGVLLQM